MAALLLLGARACALEAADVPAAFGGSGEDALYEVVACGDGLFAVGTTASNDYDLSVRTRRGETGWALRIGDDDGVRFSFCTARAGMTRMTAPAAFEDGRCSLVLADEAAQRGEWIVLDERGRSVSRVPIDGAAALCPQGTQIVQLLPVDGPEGVQLAALIGASLPADAGNEEYAREIAQYLCAKDAVGSTGNMERFLQKMDEFDLEEYIRVIHFNEIKAPTSPLQLPTARFYTGLSELMDAQLDFLKATVLSRSAGPVTMYSDLPMVVRNVKGYRNLQKKLREQSPEEVEKDPDFKVTIQTTRQVWGAIVALGILAGTTLAFSVFSLWLIITFYDAAFVALFVLCFTLTLPSLAMMIAYIRLLPITAELESTEKTA